MSYIARVQAAFAAVLTRAWWLELAEASWRQALQVAVPLFVVIQQTGTTNTAAVKAALLTLAGSEVVIVVRRLAALTAPDGADLVTRVFARAVAAFAGAVGGFVLAAPVEGVLSLSWPQIVISATGATVLALIHGFLDPAASDVVAVTDGDV